MNIVRYIVNFLLAKVAPISYARKIGVKIGDGCRIYSLHPGAFGSEPFLVSIGSGVIITAGVRFITHDGSTFLFRQEFPKIDVMGPISIGNNTFIGMNSIILPGIDIGENCIVGAMSVVTKSVPAGSVVAGNPAQYITSSSEFKRRLVERSCETGDLDGDRKEAALLGKDFEYDRKGRKWLTP